MSKDNNSDQVNKPKHYKGKDGDIECIDYIRQVLGPEQFIGYCHGNFIKYQHRYKYKGAPLQDLEKAQVYLNWAIDEMKGGEAKDNISDAAYLEKFQWSSVVTKKTHKKDKLE